jgi:hypothetical protein
MIVITVIFEGEYYLCKVADNVKEATQLIEAGYEYVCEMDNVKLFRKASNHCLKAGDVC